MLKTVPTHPGNQWGMESFFNYVGRQLRAEGYTEVTEENMNEQMAAILKRAIPAGNA